jgi:hypothetical protein
MKNTISNIIWAIIFSWMIIHGTVYATINCHDQKFSSCHRADSPEPQTVTILSGWIYELSMGGCVSPGNREICCKKAPCTTQSQFLLGSQTPNTEKHYTPFIYPYPEAPSIEPVPGVILKHHPAVQNIPIITITQSFLC